MAGLFRSVSLFFPSFKVYRRGGISNTGIDNKNETFSFNLGRFMSFVQFRNRKGEGVERETTESPLRLSDGGILLICAKLKNTFNGKERVGTLDLQSRSGFKPFPFRFGFWHS